MDLIGWGIGIAGILVGVYGVVDARRERSKRDKAVVVVNRLVGRLNGLLIGLKPSLASDARATAAADDGLEAIKLARDDLDRI
ncbi:hypothetical protein [Burkholderia diffusa]|uniref:Uncharacterized protein n=1 Tax=Burkholderia diffusa TaxID=488732 RepID=A0A6P2QYK8_9BURK|nr:hypothetical protein [Burkholderia diffusa]KAB0650291.1 hypothetical protein F7R23_24655 [Burkholderia diffusa]MBM2657014.1 hypothetical protein [Burkholderia diffusa]VWC29085.1 hypothetical protein BDI24065_06281 [Burkholderia diffusa]